MDTTATRMPVALFTSKAEGVVTVFHEAGRYGCTCRTGDGSLVKSCKHVRWVRTASERNNGVLRTAFDDGIDPGDAPVDDPFELRQWMLRSLKILRV